MYQEKLLWSEELARKVKLDFNPWAVLVGFTAGADSNIALKLASMFFPVTAVFTCNTTIASLDTLSSCESAARNYGHNYICRCPPYNGLAECNDTYEQLIKRHGFPGQTKTAHNWMYWYLKDHTVSRIVSSYRRRVRNRVVVIISGARQDESIRRMGTTQDITVKGSTVWVNLCNRWTASECHAFEAEYNLSSYRSHCSRTIGISGECWCGAFAPKGQLNELRFAAPDVYEKLSRLRSWLIANTQFNWDWDEGPPKKRDMLKPPSPTFSPNALMCSTCINNSNLII